MKATGARERRAQHFAEFRQQRECEDQAGRDRVISEFNGDLQAMADEILRCRHDVAQVAEAIDWLQKGAPFAMLRPGPHRKPRPLPVLNDWETK
jgi:hypothetical protein